MKLRALVALLISIFIFSCSETSHPLSSSIESSKANNQIQKRSSQQIFGDVYIYPKMAGFTKRLDVPASSQNNGTEIEQFKCNLGDNQIFTIENAGNGDVYIKSKSSGKYFDIPRASTSNGVNVIQYYFNGKDNQKFKLEALGNGFYRIKIKHSGKYLDIVENGAYNNKTKVCQWEWNAGDNQQFYIQLVNEVKCSWNFGGWSPIAGWYRYKPYRIDSYESGQDHQAAELYTFGYSQGTKEDVSYYRYLNQKEIDNFWGANYLTILRDDRKYNSNKIVLTFENNSKVAINYGINNLSSVVHYADDGSVTFDISDYSNGYFAIRNIEVFEDLLVGDEVELGYLTEYKHRVNGIYIY